ncbi:MAG TPA: oligosaccharide flippase family protein [Hyphomicrobiaceae bacterium]|nr:oligosaccharide flippase family protein [Hyphomicrobiaceae bacterium]
MPSAGVRRRVLGQGLLLFAGFGASQAMSLGRNALLGYLLARGDFGIAASITLTLQTVEILTDLAPDRFLMQARAGEEAHMLGAAHAMSLARGTLIALLLVLAAESLAHFFGVPEARTAFMLMALTPLIKGALHLDHRLAQKRLDNRAYLATEVGGQAAAFIVAAPLLLAYPLPIVVVWLAILQAVVAVGISHVVAEQPFRLVLDRGVLRSALAFGWPIWLSAFPLIAVYQADRLIVGRVLGMEALAAYSAAAMIAMVPGLIAAKVGQAIVLPMLSQRADDGVGFGRAYRLMLEASVIAAAGYLAVYAMAGGTLLALAFGPQYRGLDLLAAWCGAMWALRMVQAIPGMALMAQGTTRPLLIAGVVRASVVPLVAVVAVMRLPLEMIAVVGLVGELASLAVLAMALERTAVGAGLRRSTLLRIAMLTPVTGLLALAGHGLPLASTIAVAALAVLAAAFLIAGLMPGIRAMAWASINGMDNSRAADEPPQFYPTAHRNG